MSVVDSSCLFIREVLFLSHLINICILHVTFGLHDSTSRATSSLVCLSDTCLIRRFNVNDYFSVLLMSSDFNLCTRVKLRLFCVGVFVISKVNLLVSQINDNLVEVLRVT